MARNPFPQVFSNFASQLAASRREEGVQRRFEQSLAESRQSRADTQRFREQQLDAASREKATETISTRDFKDFKTGFLNVLDTHADRTIDAEGFRDISSANFQDAVVRFKSDIGFASPQFNDFERGQIDSLINDVAQKGVNPIPGDEAGTFEFSGLRIGKPIAPDAVTGDFKKAPGLFGRADEAIRKGVGAVNTAGRGTRVKGVSQGQLRRPFGTATKETSFGQQATEFADEFLEPAAFEAVQPSVPEPAVQFPNKLQGAPGFNKRSTPEQTIKVRNLSTGKTGAIPKRRLDEAIRTGRFELADTPKPVKQRRMRGTTVHF